MYIDANTLVTTAQPAPRPTAASDSDAALRQVAEEFESVFISEMLKHAKLAEANGPFSGGFAEETFRGFLVNEYADILSQSGSFGLADRIYSELKQKVGADVE